MSVTVLRRADSETTVVTTVRKLQHSDNGEDEEGGDADGCWCGCSGTRSPRIQPLGRGIWGVGERTVTTKERKRKQNAIYATQGNKNQTRT